MVLLTFSVWLVRRNVFRVLWLGANARKPSFQAHFPRKRRKSQSLPKKIKPFAQVLRQRLKNSREVQIVSELTGISEDAKEAVKSRVIVYIHSSSNMGHLSDLLDLFQKASLIPSVQSLWVLTCGASERQHQDVEGSAAAGLTRAVGNCIHKFPFFSVDVDPLNCPERNAEHVCTLLRAPPPDHEIAIAQDKCFVPRILPFVLKESKEIQTKKWKIGFCKSDESVKRNVDDLNFLTAETTPLEHDEVLVEVKAAGLNFKDVMMAMGMLVRQVRS